MSLIRRLGQRLGFLNIYYPTIYGDASRLHVGQGAELSNTIINLEGGRVVVGRETFFGHMCMLLTGKHVGTSKDHKITEGNDIIIGDHCWIASGAIILGGVTVGDRCIIAAGAIVTKDVPADTIVKGVW